MSLYLNLKPSKDAESKDAVCHLVPCKIKHNGHAYVSKYFTPYIRKEEGSTLSCSLRGHPLQGQEVKVPEGYSGVVLEEKPAVSDSVDKRELKKVGSFKSFFSWNWDRIPSNDDKIVKALDWFDVAAALHEPVGKSESNEKSSKKENLKCNGKRKLSESNE